jgi:Type II restriction endonuclease, TdeIII
MNKEERIALAIKNIISKMMDRVMDNVMIKDPFVTESHRLSKPLYSALVPDEIFKGSHFERRFVTSFGAVWEKLAKVVAIEAHGNCLMGHTIVGELEIGKLRRIQETVNKLWNSTKGVDKIKSDWNTELKYIKNGRGISYPVHVKCDIFVYDKQTNKKYAFFIDEPSTNHFKTRSIKENMLKILAMNPNKIDEVYYVIPYHYEQKPEDSNNWFNLREDKLVLIGNDFWTLIGGEGIYETIITEAKNLGYNYKKHIKTEMFEA